MLESQGSIHNLGETVPNRNAVGARGTLICQQANIADFLVATSFTSMRSYAHDFVNFVVR